MAQTKVKLVSNGVVTVDNLHVNHGITTDHVAEGSVLYYTDARVSNYLTTNNYATEAYVSTTTTNSANWDTAYSWGDHSLVGYLTSFTETDPIYTASSWYTTTNNAANWDTAFGWGNHASQGYATQTYVNTAVAGLVDAAPATLDTLNELAAALGDDPNFATTVSTSIGTKWTQDNTKISNWDTAYGWGNHASAGYLTSVPANISATSLTIGEAVLGQHSLHAGYYGLWNTEASTGTTAQYMIISAGTDTYINGDSVYIRGGNNENANELRVTTSGTTIGGSTVWHAGNLTNLNQLTNGPAYIAAGSLISEQASWDNATRFKSTGDIATTTAGNHSLQVYADINNDAFMAFHIGSDYAVYFGLENATNRLYTGGWSAGAAKYQIWDSRDFSSTNISNWNTAYGWGNHASAGYITNSATQASNVHIRNTSPTVYFRDTDHNSAMLHCNSNLLYVLRGGNDTVSWSQVNGQWPATWNLTNNLYSGGGAATFVGDVTANTSDRRLKENIKNIPNAIEKVKSINGVTFDWKEDLEEINYTRLRIHDVGVIAQEIQAVLPDAVRPAPFDTDEKGNSRSGENYLTVQYEKIVPLLIEAIKDQQQQIDELKSLLNK